MARTLTKATSLMLPPLHLPLSHGACLALTVSAIRRETAAMMTAGDLGVSADHLLGGHTHVSDWLDDLTLSTVASDGGEVVVPPRDLATLPHIVYTLSAILVWVDELHHEGREVTPIPAAALAAWSAIEAAADLRGRTTRALRHRPEDAAALTELAMDHPALAVPAGTAA